MEIIRLISMPFSWTVKFQRLCEQRIKKTINRGSYHINKEVCKIGYRYRMYVLFIKENDII
jgi:hypothetical protein